MLLPDLLRQYSIELYHGRQLIYPAEPASEAASSEIGRYSQTLTLGNQDWRIQATPTGETQDKAATFASMTILTMGAYSFR